MATKSAKGVRELDPSLPETLTEQLVSLIEGQIKSGELQPRTKLTPSVDMADQLGVSRSTVTAAMKVLTDEGLVRWVKGKGLFTTEPAVISEWIKHQQP